MPPQRTPLGTISSNRQFNGHLKPYMRGVVHGLHLKGATPTQIALGLELDRGTVRYTIQQDPFRDDGETLPKDPRRKSYTLAEERLLLRHVRLNPKDTYATVIHVLGL